MGDVDQGGDLITETMGDQTSIGDGLSDNQSTAGSEGQDATSGIDGSKDLPNWQKQLTPELQGNRTLGKFNTKSPISDLASAYIEAEGRLGKSILVPGENASDEERSRFLSQLRGVEAKDGYKLTDVQLPEGVKLPDGTEEAFKEMAFDAGLNQNQADALWKYQGGLLAKSVQMARSLAQKRIEEAKAELKDAWKGDYDKNLELATRAMKTFLAKDELAELKSSGQANDPRLWKRWARVGARMGETLMPDGDANAQSESQGMQFNLAKELAAGKQP